MGLTSLMICLALSAGAEPPKNLVRNPGFEIATGRAGEPDDWRSSGDSAVVQRLSRDVGRDGGYCARLECTRFEHRGAASHAMLCQHGVTVRRGVWYRLSFWVRGQNLSADGIHLAISDTSVWASCGLDDSTPVTSEWTRQEVFFRGTRDAAEKTRLQMWFLSTGVLWVDDVELVEVSQSPHRPGMVVPAKGAKNLVPNASFECGPWNWGSTPADRNTHWGGSLNNLVGAIDNREAFHGRNSLRIDLSPETCPVSYFDYYDLIRQPILAPLAANIGLLEVEPGQTYVLSVYLKADRDAPARLAVSEFQGRTSGQAVQVSRQWRRHAMTVRPRARWCYVSAGPDLRPTPQASQAPDRVTMWVDAVQFERGDAPSKFESRQAIELGLATSKPGNVFGLDEPIVLRLDYGRKPATRDATVELRLTDYFERDVWRRTIRHGENVPDSEEVRIPPSPRLQGFLRVHAQLKSGSLVQEQTMRMAAIRRYEAADSRFGVNHAYPWPHLLDLCRQAGLVWVRDWSLKWQQVEPEKGRFDFGETDFQIDRPRRHGLNVLGLLPFPSANWSSSAPDSVRASDRYPENRMRAAYAPRSEAELEDYVARTVTHYRDRIHWWQVFNEPLYTSYALPRKEGYDGTTYAKLTKAFAQAARRADPQAQVLAGIGGLPEGEIRNDFERFFAAGGLAAVDAIDIHHYPRLRTPEFAAEVLEQFNRLMDKHGGRKPIWLTEYGYYADDEPWCVPMPHGGFDRPLPSEQVQADYAVRWNTIMLAGGVERIFYHAGTCAGVNGDSLQGVFFEYAGQPHKIYAAQAAMARLLTPSCRLVKRLALGEGVWGFLFADGPRTVAVVWSPREGADRTIRVPHAKVEVLDIVGRATGQREFTPGPSPVYLVGEGVPAAAFSFP